MDCINFQLINPWDAHGLHQSLTSYNAILTSSTMSLKVPHTFSVSFPVHRWHISNSNWLVLIAISFPYFLGTGSSILRSQQEFSVKKTFLALVHVYFLNAWNWLANHNPFAMPRNPVNLQIGQQICREPLSLLWFVPLLPLLMITKMHRACCVQAGVLKLSIHRSVWFWQRPCPGR